MGQDLTWKCWRTFLLTSSLSFVIASAIINETIDLTFNREFEVDSNSSITTVLQPPPEVTSAMTLRQKRDTPENTLLSPADAFRQKLAASSEEWRRKSASRSSPAAYSTNPPNIGSRFENMFGPFPATTTTTMRPNERLVAPKPRFTGQGPSNSLQLPFMSLRNSNWKQSKNDRKKRVEQKQLMYKNKRVKFDDRPEDQALVQKMDPYVEQKEVRNKKKKKKVKPPVVVKQEETTTTTTTTDAPKEAPPVQEKPPSYKDYGIHFMSDGGYNEPLNLHQGHQQAPGIDRHEHVRNCILKDFHKFWEPVIPIDPRSTFFQPTSDLQQTCRVYIEKMEELRSQCKTAMERLSIAGLTDAPTPRLLDRKEWWKSIDFKKLD